MLNHNILLDTQQLQFEGRAVVSRGSWQPCDYFVWPGKPEGFLRAAACTSQVTRFLELTTTE